MSMYSSTAAVEQKTEGFWPDQAMAPMGGRCVGHGGARAASQI